MYADVTVARLTQLEARFMSCVKEEYLEGRNKLPTSSVSGAKSSNPVHEKIAILQIVGKLRQQNCRNLFDVSHYQSAAACVH